MELAEPRRWWSGRFAALAGAIVLVLVARGASLALGPSRAAAEASLAAERGHRPAAPRGRILDAHGEVLASNRGEARVIADGAPASVIGHPARSAPAGAAERAATGLEQAFDAELRKSSDVTATLDLALQREATAALAGAGITRATLVAVDPRDGAIRAALATEDADETDATRSHTLPPGGLVFPFLALEARSRDVPTSFVCIGAWIKEGRARPCTHSHDRIESAEAIERGCAVHFLALGDALGGQGVTEAIRGAGLFVTAPDDAPLARVDVEEASLGQGSVRASTVDVALAYSALANGGTLLAARTRASDPAVVRRELPGREARGPIVAALAARGVAMGGPPSVAATFAVAELPRRSDSDETPRATWFVGFAPASSPRALVVLVSEASPRAAVDRAGFALVEASLRGARP